MATKKITEATDKELWADFHAAEREAWCCRAVKETSRHIQFKDVMRMGVHFCPRCGRKL